MEPNESAIALETGRHLQDSKQKDRRAYISSISACAQHCWLLLHVWGKIHFARSHWGKTRPLLNASICQMRAYSLAVVVLGSSGTRFGPQSVSADETLGGCSEHSSLIWKLLPQWQKIEQNPALVPTQYRKLGINIKKEEGIKLMRTINWRPALAEGCRS